MPPAPEGGLRGLLLDIGGVVHATGIHLVGRLGLPVEQIVFLDDMPGNVAGARRVGMTAVRVPWEDPGPAIDTARTLLRLPSRQSRGDDY